VAHKNPEDKIAYDKAYARKHKDKIRYSSLKWARSNPERVLENHIKRNGITIVQYKELFKEQEGKCAICKVPQSQLKRRLSVDHDHDTKQIRGLLCQPCNLALGMFNDSVTTLSSAIGYLGYDDDWKCNICNGTEQWFDRSITYSSDGTEHGMTMRCVHCGTSTDTWVKRGQK
jgi:hypothetical protein